MTDLFGDPPPPQVKAVPPQAPRPEPETSIADRAPGTRIARVHHLAYAFKASDRWEPMVLAIADPGEVKRQADFRRNDPTHYACVKVSGPHEHEVPE